MSFPLVLGMVVLVWLLLPWRRPMASREALALFELTPNDGPEAIRAAHRRLIARVHPDAGGSRELAARACSSSRPGVSITTTSWSAA